jgi:hypothetical protein
MTKMEKRHFVAEQKRLSTKNNIFLLYQEVHKSTDYNEAELRVVFKGTSFVKILPTIKNQLYKALLASLRDFHKNTYIDIIIRNEFTEIDLLIKKKLYDHALKKINAIKKKIEKHERFTYYMELILKETELKFYTQKNKDFSSEINRSITTARSVGRNFYLYAYQKLMLFRTQSMLWDGKDFSEINYNPLREKNISSVRSANYYHLHHSLLFLIQTKEFPSALFQSDQLIELMEENPHEFDDNPEQKVDVWYACGMAYLYNNKQVKTEKIIQNLKEFTLITPKIKIRRDERLIDLQLLQMYVNGGDQKELHLIQEQVETDSKQYSNFYAQKFWDTLSSIYLKENDYKQSLKCNYNLLIYKKTKRANHYFIRATLREIYLYYIQGKISVFESRYKSVLRSSLPISEQEKTLLKNLRKDKKIRAFKAYLLRKKKS